MMQQNFILLNKRGVSLTDALISPIKLRTFKGNERELRDQLPTDFPIMENSRLQTCSPLYYSNKPCTSALSL